MNKKELWLKLKACHFDHIVPPHLWEHITGAFGGADASTKAFAGKIARKTGWKNKFALKALTVYKKFVYPGVVSDFNVTPSKIIDQVWHEHLLFSKAYRQFCNDVIEYTLDHNPELVPMADQTGNFNIQYMNTIALYKTEFGIDPPADIWSVPKFDQTKIMTDSYESNEKARKNSSTGNTTYSDAALVSFFDASPHEGYSSQNFPEFGGFGGGDAGGGGTSGSWDDHNSDVDSPGNNNSNDSSSDSGGDGGGSGCSSGCGGGGDRIYFIPGRKQTNK